MINKIADFGSACLIGEPYGDIGGTNEYLVSERIESNSRKAVLFWSHFYLVQAPANHTKVFSLVLW